RRGLHGRAVRVGPALDQQDRCRHRSRSVGGAGVSRGVLHRAAAIVGVAFIAILGSAGVAMAGNGFAMSVDVHNSQQTITGEQNGMCTWRVTSDVTLVQLTNESLSITGVTDAVNWTADDNTSGVVNDVTIVDDAGLE